ncbi:MAG: GGDEF domain-containing protein [Burkholderiales bacterium]|nr:GGDEF domain-containing protein [Burkholderiales bacterium]
MKRDNYERDLAILKRLRAQAEEVEALRARVAQLELEKNALLRTSGRMNEELEHYLQVKKEWDWFFDNSPDLLCIAGTDAYFKRVNPAFTETLGYSAEELLRHPFFHFVHPDDIERTQRELQKLNEGQDCINFENRYRDSAGNWHWLAWRCPGTTPNVPLIYAIARDITEQKRSEAEILYLAEHDPLTGLSNRAAFESELASAIARTERDAKKRLALLMIDLDGFKAINDNYGHAAGDHLLKLVAARFQSMQRRSDLVCRLGGDEFAWLTEGAARTETEALAARLSEAILRPFALEEITLTIGCSIGISSFPWPARNAADLLKQADAAMYKVKKTGKNGYLSYR